MGAIDGCNIVEQFIGDWFVFDLFTIDKQAVVPQFDGVSRLADGALHQARSILRRVKD